MNIVGSVVGCFVGLWCLCVTRCEIVMVSGVYRKLVYCFGLPRYTARIHIICIHLLLLNYTDLHTGYPPSHPFAICIAITSVNWFRYIYSHFLVLTLPHTGPNAKARSRWRSEER